MSGCSMENSTIIKITNETEARAKHVRMNGDVQPPVFHAALASASARRSVVRNTVTERKPTKSNERTDSVLYSRWIISVATMAKSPTGTFTSKIMCHEKLSHRYPPISGPNETDAAAEIAQNPSAMPRFSGGNSRV